MKIRKMLLFSKAISVSLVFQYQPKIIRVIELKKKRINFLFIAVIYFPFNDRNEHITLYYICYVILAIYIYA